MSQAAVNHILQQLQSLSEEELRYIDQAIKDQLKPPKHTGKREALYANLKARGLIEEIRKSPLEDDALPPLIEVPGKPVSQTIIEERR
jgi:hypothetical protein